MKQNPKTARFVMAALSAVILSPIAVVAQRAPDVAATGADAPSKPVPVVTRASSTSQAPADEDVIILSPFEVRTDRDVGFVAASSLAGGRLAGDLKDTPIAYTVLTKEFIDALQLTDLTEMARWSTNSMDVPNDGGEYGLASTDGVAMRISSRGVGSNQPQKNFFPVYYSFDSYNLERLDLARGPNAVLFGTSSLGGTANSITKRAMTNRISGEVRIGFASWGNLRTTMDYNQPIGGKLAVRVNGLYQERDGWRDTEYEERKGATLAATWKVTKNTEIRAEYERGIMRKSIQTSLKDNISGWDGLSTFSAITAANNAKGVAIYGAGQAIYSPDAGDYLMNYQGWAYTLGGYRNNNVPAGGVVVVGENPNIWRNSIIEQLNLPKDLYDLAIAGSGGRFQLPDRRTSTFSDEPIYKIKNDEFSLAMTQRIGRNLFAEVALNKGKEDSSSDIGVARMGDVFIDLNTKLPNGEDNPNFLQPYGEFLSRPTYQYRTKENARVAVGYVTDRTRLGTFSFNVMGGISNEKLDKNTFRYVVKDPAVDHRDWISNKTIYYRYYIFTTPERPMPKPGSWTYDNPRASGSNPRISTVSSGLVRETPDINANFNQVIEKDYKYLQAAMSSKLFDDKLSIILSGRIDRYSARQENMEDRYDHPEDWDGNTRIMKPSAPEDWLYLTYRERRDDGTPTGDPLPANTRPRDSSGRPLPQYANDRFQDDYSPMDSEDTVKSVSVGAVYHATKFASVFANYADSFAPPTAGLKLDGSLFPGRVSHGWDAGMRFTLLKGRVVASAIYYNGKEDNAQIGTTDFPLRDILRARPVDRIDGINSYLKMLPAGWYDSQQTKTKGFEFEVTANLTRNWRLMFNAALPESFSSGRNKETLVYYAANESTLRLIIEEAGGAFAGNRAVTDTSASIPPENANLTAQAITAWNTLQDSMASVAAGTQKRTRVPKLNLNCFTDYMFGSGFLKGLRIGAGVNYRGRQAIGYRGADTIVDPNDPTKAIDDPSVNEYNTVEIAGYAVATATLSYAFKLNRKVQIILDLKIDNLFDYDKPLYYDVAMRPAGGDLQSPARVATPNNYYWVMPRNITFTARLKF